MKKKYLSSIMAFVMAFAVLSGCGDVSLGRGDADTEDEGEEDTEKETEDSEEDSEEENKETEEADEEEEQSSTEFEKGQVAGPDSQWDGSFVDDYGVKFYAGMTIKELQDQGCIVSYHYRGSEIEDRLTAMDEMYVGPYGGEMGNGPDCLDIWDNVDGEYIESDFSEDCWIYNPYPYAVPFNECIIGQLLASTDNLPEVFFQDDDSKIYPEEVRAFMDISPIVDDNNQIYTFDKFYVELDFYEGYLTGPINSGVYTHYWYSDEFVDEYFTPYYPMVEGHEYVSKELDTSLDTLEFEMSGETYSLDLSLFTSIESSYIHYYEESDYTSEVYIEGEDTNGDHIIFWVEDDSYDSYWGVHQDASGDGKEASNGEVIEYNYAGYAYLTLLGNSNIQFMLYVTDGDDPDHLLEMKDYVESYITAKD